MFGIHVASIGLIIWIIVSWQYQMAKVCRCPSKSTVNISRRYIRALEDVNMTLEADIKVFTMLGDIHQDNPKSFLLCE